MDASLFLRKLDLLRAMKADLPRMKASYDFL